MSQKEIADRLEITQAYWSTLERGKQELSANIIRALSLQFDISPSWLLTGKGQPLESGHGINDAFIINEISDVDRLLNEVYQKILSVIELREKAFGWDENQGAYVETLLKQIQEVNLLHMNLSLNRSGDNESINLRNLLARMKDLLTAFNMDFDELFHQYYLHVIYPEKKVVFEAPRNVLSKVEK